MKQGFFPEQVDETKINKFLVLPAFSNLFAIFLVVVVASPDDIPTCKKKKKKIPKLWYKKWKHIATQFKDKQGFKVMW